MNEIGIYLAPIVLALILINIDLVIASEIVNLTDSDVVTTPTFKIPSNRNKYIELNSTDVDISLTSTVSITDISSTEKNSLSTDLDSENNDGTKISNSPQIFDDNYPSNKTLKKESPILNILRDENFTLDATKTDIPTTSVESLKEKCTKDEDSLIIGYQSEHSDILSKISCADLPNEMTKLTFNNGDDDSLIFPESTIFQKLTTETTVTNPALSPEINTVYDETMEIPITSSKSNEVGTSTIATRNIFQSLLETKPEMTSTVNPDEYQNLNAAITKIEPKNNMYDDRTKITDFTVKTNFRYKKTTEIPAGRSKNNDLDISTEAVDTLTQIMPTKTSDKHPNLDKEMTLKFTSDKNIYNYTTTESSDIQNEFEIFTSVSENFSQNISPIKQNSFVTENTIFDKATTVETTSTDQREIKQSTPKMSTTSTDNLIQDLLETKPKITTNHNLFSNIETSTVQSTNNERHTTLSFSSSIDMSDSASTLLATEEASTVGKTCEVYGINVTKYDAQKSKIITKWNIETYDSSNISSCKFLLNVSCETIREINVKVKIPPKSVEVEVKSDTVVTVLTNLTESTDYNCESKLKDDSNHVIATQNFNFTTLPIVPSNVNFTIVETTANSVSLEWNRPLKLPGTLKMYHILAQNNGPRHYVRDKCKSRSTGTSVSFSSERELLSYTFENLDPNNEYEIEILAENNNGNSTGIRQTIITNNSYSTEPLNLVSEVFTSSNNCNNTKYNSTLVIKWELPCNTNGMLQEFEVQVMGSQYMSVINASKWTEDKNITNMLYQHYVPNLNASSTYNFTITPISEGNLRGNASRITSKKTPDGCPSQPSTVTLSNPNTSHFNITWSEPIEYYGELLEYEIEIEPVNPNHFVSKDKECSLPMKIFKYYSIANNWAFDKGMAHFNYRIRIRAQTSAGFGKYSDYKYVTTKAKESEPVRDITITKSSDTISSETYEYKVLLKFKEPCNTNGPFKSYSIIVNGYRIGYDNHTFRDEIRVVHDTFKEIKLYKPEYNYTFEIEVITENFKSNSVKENILTSAGIPSLHAEELECNINVDSSTEIDVLLSRDLFGSNNGEIVYYAIILMMTEVKNPTPRYSYFGFWNENWPIANETVIRYEKPKDIIQITANYWNPFKDDIHQLKFSVGKTHDCNSYDYCHSLLEDTNYIVVLRGLTRSTYREVYTLVRTGTTSTHLEIFFLLIFFCIVIIVGIVSVYYVKRRKVWTRFRNVSNPIITEVITQRHSVSVKHFISYYNKITNDPTLLKRQYEDIEDEIKVYKENNIHTTFALKPENKRKNRYSNILPYDECRVKLNIDEDDEISSDYINASYIKGFTAEVEYIATQGPLEHTCKDFWKMVIQENVTVIVMVSQFVEKEKDKCFKYFPKNHENMLISDDIEVKCLTELQFDTYCIRTLLVRRDIKQYTVVHMQYLEWPDFGCPAGTNNMLSFCQEVRDRIQLENGLMIVHCSAGVGRTGTLISLDILLQTIRRKKEISVFETVMELRRQRTHMVQTEKQYVYIHKCIKDVLENASLYLCGDTKKNEEHIYENTPDFSKKAFQANEKESAF